MPPENGVQRHEEDYGRHGFRVKQSHSRRSLRKTGWNARSRNQPLRSEAVPEGMTEVTKVTPLFSFFPLYQRYRTRDRKRVTYVTASPSPSNTRPPVRVGEVGEVG